MTRSRNHDNENGAILPIFAFMIVVLLMFAALAVDLGAAWAERRQDQTAADAAAMAAGLQYLHDDATPSSHVTIGIVIDYVERNLTNPPTVDEWKACIDTGKPDANYVALRDNDDTPYDCISLRQEADAPVRIRVRIPDRDVPTSFARLMGVDSIAVSAAAIAELQYSDFAKILPFSLPSLPSTEECLGVPPNGHNDGDVAPCADGSDSGNFGLIDSPWFGSGPPHDTGDTCFDGDYETRTELNLALGIDHIVKPWPPPPAVPTIPAINVDLKGYPEGVDSCDTAESDEEPFILLTQTGTETGNDETFSDGMIGDGPYGTNGAPGKLRQTGGLNDGDAGDTLFFDDPGRPGSLDNVGLWEYLDDGLTGECDFSDSDLVGRARTNQMIACADYTGAPGETEPSFLTRAEQFLESPRFAVVPVLTYTPGAISGTSGYAIIEMLPVYIQSTWYDCTNNGIGCLFHPEDFINPDLIYADGQDPDWDDTIPEWYTPVFNPGEGTTEPCQSKKGYDDSKPDDFACEDPSKIMLAGASGIVLQWEWLGLTAENAIGSNSPYKVELYR